MNYENSDAKAMEEFIYNKNHIQYSFPNIQKKNTSITSMSSAQTSVSFR